MCDLRGKIFLVIIQGVFNALIGAIQLAFLLRAVLSWFQDGSGDFISTAYEVTCNFTEPLIIPVRMILDRFSFARGLPIDLAFFITYMLILIIDIIL